MRIKKLQSKIEDILRRFPETRNDDVVLLIRIWEIYYPDFIKTGSNGNRGVWLEDILKLPREDAVKRIRAHIQNDLGVFLPDDPKVRKVRRISEEEWKEWARSNTEYKRI